MFFITLFAVSIGFALLNRWMLLRANSKIWNKKILKIAARFLPYISLFFSFIWGFGSIINKTSISVLGVAATSLTLVLNVLLLMSLPVSLLVEFIINKRQSSRPQPDQSSRRLFLKAASASFPVFAMGCTAAGVASSFSGVRFPRIEVFYRHLPAALDGFRILQLSDLHLGYFFRLSDLEQTLLEAEKLSADMVVVTGDIADNIWKMTETTQLIDQLKAPFGKYISVGNHEYYRSIKRSIIYIEKGPIPLLLNTHHIIDVKGTKLLVGGADDPVYSKSDMHTFLDDSIGKMLANAPHADFKLLMSHRPRALDLAPKYSIDLTLAGHTHGGQIGWGGKSLWEIFGDNGYLWGLYKNADSQLYTTAGVGHWFPFRLNCPPEAPLIVLRKSESSVA